MKRKKFVIAIDGTAASGKGTISKELAKILKFEYLDTGILYRLVAYLSLKEGNGIINERIASQISLKLNLKKKVKMNLHTNEISQAASKVALIKSVRDNLLKLQRNFPEKQFGSIIDGRDIGTIIFPNADIKFFVTAKESIRASRRYDQLKLHDKSINFKKVCFELKKRDVRDYSREIAPLKCHQNAYLIDTSNLDVKDSVNIAMKIIENKLQNF